MKYINNSITAWTSTGVCLIITAVLTANIIQLNTEKEELEEEKKKLDSEISNLEEENEEVTSDLEDVSKEVKKIKKKNKKLNKKVEKKDKKIRKKDSIIKEKDKNIKEKNNKIKKLEKPKTQINNSEASGDTAKSGNGKTLTMNSSYYSMNCPGCTGRTASGYKLNKGQTTVDGYRVVAADTSIIPLHSIIKVTNPDGSSYKAKVMDRGGAIKGHKLDILVGSTEEAYRKGRHNTTVEIISYGDNKYRKVN